VALDSKIYAAQGGARDAYFAWSVNPKTGKHNAEGSRISFSAGGLTRLKISLIQTGRFPHSFFPQEDIRNYVILSDLFPHLPQLP
jgi:hypothetical protein